MRLERNGVTSQNQTRTCIIKSHKHPSSHQNIWMVQHFVMNLCEEAVVGRGAGSVGAHPGEGGVEGELMGSATRQRKGQRFICEALLWRGTKKRSNGRDAKKLENCSNEVDLYP